MENLVERGEAGSHYSMLVFHLRLLDPAMFVANKQWACVCATVD